MRCRLYINLCSDLSNIRTHYLLISSAWHTHSEHEQLAEINVLSDCDVLLNKKRVTTAGVHNNSLNSKTTAAATASIYLLTSELEYLEIKLRKT